MKTSLLLLAAGSLLLASCKSDRDNFEPNAGSPTNQIYAFLVESNVSSAGNSDPDPDSHQVTWTFRTKNHQALADKIYSKQVVEWHFRSSFMLYINETASSVNWDLCTDPAGNKLPWITNGLPCPLDQPKHRALCATNTGDYTVSLVFPTNTAPKDTRIKYRLVTGLDCPQAAQQANVKNLSSTYDYYMVEAILVWSDPTAQETRDKPSH